MDASSSQELMKLGLVLDQYLMRLIGLNLFIGGPILVALCQIGLAIREIALNSRKEYSADEYDSLKWIATVLMYIGWIMMPCGVILLVRSL